MKRSDVYLSVKEGTKVAVLDRVVVEEVTTEEGAI
jgi:hypothetical protein